eukprot:scaffold529_cov308-Pinguiococcus_pyrenoidosus.AAC.4
MWSACSSGWSHGSRSITGGAQTKLARCQDQAGVRIRQERRSPSSREEASRVQCRPKEEKKVPPEAERGACTTMR